MEQSAGMTGFLAVLFCIAVGILAGWLGRGKWDQRKARKAKVKEGGDEGTKAS